MKKLIFILLVFVCFNCFSQELNQISFELPEVEFQAFDGSGLPFASMEKDKQTHVLYGILMGGATKAISFYYTGSETKSTWISLAITSAFIFGKEFILDDKPDKGDIAAGYLGWMIPQVGATIYHDGFKKWTFN